jgi:hypothetical protein
VSTGIRVDASNQEENAVFGGLDTGVLVSIDHTDSGLEAAPVIQIVSII